MVTVARADRVRLSISRNISVGLNIPQIELWAIWVGGTHCVIVTKLWGAQIFGVGGFKHPYDIVPTNHTFGCFLRPSP